MMDLLINIVKFYIYLIIFCVFCGYILPVLIPLAQAIMELVARGVGASMGTNKINKK